MCSPLEKDAFEAAFSEFLESDECDDKNWVIFELMRCAFEAGYRAAGGVPPKRRKHK